MTAFGGEADPTSNRANGLRRQIEARDLILGSWSEHLLTNLIKPTINFI
jgi:hypothetical protein